MLIDANAPTAAADRWYAPQPLLGIVDAGRASAAARQAGATWDRALFLWQEIQPNGPTDWQLDRYVDAAALGPTLSSGVPVVGVVQGTPAWADTDWHDAAAGVPTGLDLPLEDSRNTFGQFMLRLARTYKGRISTWVLWNEPDFLPGESGTWWTWSGSAADFAKLLRTGYRAIKQADPTATVVFPSTTYFADAVHGRDLFLARVLAELNSDPDARKNGFYFDAVGLNLYCSLDAVYRVYGVYQSVLDSFQLQKPIWLTETNCPVYNDPATPESPNGRITTDEQSAYLLEAIALARAAGYQRVGWYSMVDHAPSSGIVDRWGLLRSDGSPRPAYRALQVASQYLASPTSTVRLASFGTPNPDGWPLTRVVIDDLPSRTRVQVLWRTAAGPASVRVEAAASSASLIDPLGQTLSAQRVDGGWEVPLPAARVAQDSDPPGFAAVGDPVLLMERDLAAGALLALPVVSSAAMAMVPAAPIVAAARPPVVAVTRPAGMPAVTQPGPSLVLSINNPQPNDLVPRAKVVMQGEAFDRAATSGSGVDRVSVFLDNRDSGGQHIGDATLGSPGATGFTVTADLSRASGNHTLFVYARSSVTGHEAVVSFPIAVGAR